MNKSKFLKKSLAMLLALMLVFAMIPLSASAAEGESVYFKDLYVNGQRAAVNGDQLSSDVVETTTVDLTVGTLNGAELYVDVKNTENDKALPCYNLDLTDETVATKTGDNKYQVGILVKVKDNPESDDARLVESYTLTIAVEEIKEGDDVLLRGLQAGKETWANMVSYEVIHPEEGEDTGLVNITLKFGYDEPTWTPGQLTTDFEAIDPNSDVYVVTCDPDTDDYTIAVESEKGSRSTYKLAYTWQAAFESFKIPGQDGETEFVWDGQDGNKININVPYAYSFSDVIASFEFANDVDKVKGQTADTTDLIYSDYTVLDKLKDWSDDATDGAQWKNQATLNMSVPRGSDWAYITLTITGVAKNAEGDLKTIQITDDEDNKSNTTEAKYSTFEVEMPKGTDLTSNTITVTMVASKDATVNVIGHDPQATIAVDKTAIDATTSKYEASFTTGDDKDTYSFTVQVTPEAGGATKNYNVNMTTPAIAKAQLKSLIVSNGTESYEAQINQTTGVVRLTIPYSWSNFRNTRDVKIYMKASTGATIKHEDGTVWPFEGSVPFNGHNGASKYWLPKIDGDVDNEDETPSIITVADNDPTTQDENTYKIYVETAPAKTERKISDITFVGTDKPYEITPSNTYETTLGTAKLADGTEVRTIEVTVPYSYTNENAYISDWTISEGAVAYGGWGTVTAFKPLGDNSETNKYPWAFELDKYMDGKGDNGTLQEGRYLKIYVLSEEYAVPEKNDSGNLTDLTDYLGKPFVDKQNVSIYYLVAKRAPAETGHEMLSIESTVDKNVTATLEGTTITINVPASYKTNKTQFSLNFELSKLAKLYAENDFTNETAIIASDNGSALTADRTMFAFGADGTFKYKDGDDEFQPLGEKVYVYSESGNQSQAYDVKVNVNKPETGASITALSVNGTAGTITQDKINVRLPLGSKLYPVTLDIEASKMAKVEIGGKAYNPENKYDVNDEVKITVTSENGEVVNNYYLNVTVSDSFNDVSSSEWYYDEVMTAANAGWINGTKPGYFEPNGTMTRADFMVIIARILDCDTEATVESLFPDCNETDYFNAAVTFCKQRGIIDGDDKGYFNPKDPITREEMAKILCNALELDELETSANPFDDDAEIAQWAKGYVNAVQAEGIMEGSNGSFNPRDNATRAEGAAVLVRAFA